MQEDRVKSPSFADLLRRYRLAAGLTQEELAERAHLSRKAISALERGERQSPRKDTVFLLAAALALSEEEGADLLAAARRHRGLAPPTSPASAAPSPAAPSPAAPLSGSPLSSPELSATKLPRPPTPLIGREQEIALALARLGSEEVRLLTLTGVGGVGKTRLALEVTSRLRPTLLDGVFLVPLAALADPDLVAVSMMQALGLQERGGRQPSAILRAYLRDKRLLLLLDNFEHLLPAATLLSDLLAACPGLSLLVTSRAVLQIRGEQVLPIAPFPVPDPSIPLSLEALAATPAVALFVQRAQAAQPAFALTPENVGNVAAICRRLDGLPLALELAAARIRLLPAQALLARLERRLPLLVGGARDLPERQRTLRDTIAWSYDLLSSAEQALLRRLSVFVGGATLEAVEAVCPLGAASAAEMLEELAVLVDQSLLRQEASPAGDARVGMLETIREYALEQLEASGEVATLRERHAAFFLKVAEEAEVRLRGAEQQACMARLEQDHDNLRAALGWAEEGGELELGLRLGGALRYFWQMGYLSEGRTWLEALLARADALDQRGVTPRARAKALNCAAWLAHTQADDVSATRLAEQARTLLQDPADRYDRGFALTTLAMVALNQNNYQRATALQEEALALYREERDDWAIAGCLNNLGLLAGLQGDFARASALLEEKVARDRRRGDRRATALSLSNLAAFEYVQGHLAQAQRLWTESLTLSRELGGTRRDAVVFEGVEGLAEIAAAQGQARRAIQLLAAAEALRAAVEVPRPPYMQAAFEDAMAAARTALDPGEFAAAQAEGTALSMEQVVAAALGPA